MISYMRKKDIRESGLLMETSYITFHPNTIVYAIPAKSPLSLLENPADPRSVWFGTLTYRGKSFESMSASLLEKEIASNLKDTRSKSLVSRRSI